MGLSENVSGNFEEEHYYMVKPLWKPVGASVIRTGLGFRVWGIFTEYLLFECAWGETFELSEEGYLIRVPNMEQLSFGSLSKSRNPREHIGRY